MIKYNYYNTGEDQKSFAVSMTIGKTPVDTLPNGDLQNYQLTPDGKRILYTEVRDGFQHIWWCNSDGSDQVQLTETNSTNGDFSISPSGISYSLYPIVQVRRNFIF